LPSSADGDAAAIRSFLQQSARAWNRTDLDGFMRGYENSPETEYISRSTVLHGYAAIRAHYAAHYGTFRGMGRLRFSDVSIRPLGAAYAVVVARWHLALPNGTSPTGLFSLVLHRSPAGWHIIADHSP
jgi:ketosteroid isomerase-like protein